MQSLRSQLWKLTIPIFVEVTLVMLVGAVDTFMLSSCGDGAVAAVGLDNQLIMLVFLVFQFTSVGVGIVCAQYYGAGLRQRLVQVVGIALLFNAVLGLAASAWLFFEAESVLRLMGLPADLLDASHWMNLLLLLPANVTFLVMDRALERLTILWHRKLRKRFFR